MFGFKGQLPRLLHQATQRRFCRLVFLVGCLLPTVVVAGWVTWEKLPSTAERRLAKLERLLGIQVEVEQLLTPRPSLWRAVGLTLRDVETGNALAEANSLELCYQANVLRLQCDRLELASGELAALGGVCHRWIAVDWPETVLISAKQVELQGRPAGSLTGAIKTWGPAEHPTGRRMVLHLQDQPGGKPLSLTVTRNRMTMPPSTRLTLETGDRCCSGDGLCLLAPWMGELDHAAKFRGMLKLTWTGSERRGELHGNLESVHLGEWLGMGRPTLDCMGQVALEQLAWVNDRVTQARGTMSAQGGSVGRELLTVARTFYQQPQLAHQQAGDQPLKFAELGVEFELTERGLVLFGSCQRTTKGGEPSRNAPCVVDLQGRPLLGAPYYRLPAEMLPPMVAQVQRSPVLEVAAGLPPMSRTAR